MKLFILHEMTFKGHSRSMAMSSFVRSPRLSIRDLKTKLHLCSDKTRRLTRPKSGNVASRFLVLFHDLFARFCCCAPKNKFLGMPLM